MKRVIDVLVAAIVLVLAAPVLLAAAIAIRVNSPGPVLYRGRRLGRDGRVFTMHKLRTMYVDAEQRLVDLMHLNIGEGMVKIPDDPRQTAVGRVLRKWSIDELPQLWDVLRGEMSLVGPRPHVPGEVPDGDDRLLSRLVMRPGMTGLWQITARNHPALETRVRCDLEYIRGWSLLADLQILVRTVPAVLRGDGSTARLEAQAEALRIRIEGASANLSLVDLGGALAAEPARYEEAV